MSVFVRAAHRGENHWAFYLLTVLVVFIGYVIGQVPLLLVLNEKVDSGNISREQAAAFFENADFSQIGMSSHVGLLLLLGSFIAAAILLFICVEFIHKRAFRTLIRANKQVNVRKLLVAFGLWFVLTALAEFVAYLIYPGAYTFHFNWQNWLPLLAISLLILPIQTSFEEVFTRGYLLQGIGSATGSQIAAVMGSSLVFAAMHLANPEVREFGLVVMMFYYLSVAISLAIITLLDDGLEYALGIHAATNVYGASFVSFEGSALRTDTLLQVEQVDPLLMLILFYVTMAIFFVIIHKTFKLKPLRSLLSRVAPDLPEQQSDDHL
ncbi:MAG: CPBP family intramembrane glutamic endopeptidase [Saprospiraceae bacterium]|nr:CPBP family intramembrane glutamic endopeptidase [Saprospiraceae bacterium]